MKKIKNNKGITLVALIITIIVLLILAVVAISAVNGDGIISKAKLARENYQTAQEEENLALAGYQATLDNINNERNGGENSNPQQDNIAKSDVSYVGYYADVDNDGTPDGIIYVDLMETEEKTISGNWNNESWATYSYTTITTSKTYYITNANYSGSFGSKPIISVEQGSEGNDRFYVIALNDISGTYTWSESKNLNTDIWHVPSLNEWCALGDNMKINFNNTFNFTTGYWIESNSFEMGEYIMAYYANPGGSPSLSFYTISDKFNIRLCTNF